MVRIAENEDEWARLRDVGFEGLVYEASTGRPYMYMYDRYM